MLEVKKARAAEAGSDPTTAQYVDRMERERRPVTIHGDTVGIVRVLLGARATLR